MNRLVGSASLSHLSASRLGGSFSGVEVDNLLGLMECLCVVCNAPVSKKQEDLLAATKWLLQDQVVNFFELFGPFLNKNLAQKLES